MKSSSLFLGPLVALGDLAWRQAMESFGRKTDLLLELRCKVAFALVHKSKPGFQLFEGFPPMLVQLCCMISDQ